MKSKLLFTFALVVASAALARAETATYNDFTGYAIRPNSNASYTTGVTSDNNNETFTVTAVNGGKIAIGTSAINGHTVSDLVNCKFSNSSTVTEAGNMVYFNFWVTDKTGNYAFVAVHETNATTHLQDDYPVYGKLTSTSGMSASYFQNLAVRVYATNTTDLDWLYSGCNRMVKYGGWDSCLWKSSDTGTFDPVLVSDLADLSFGSPFTTTTVPGISGNAEWTYAGTGDPQTPDTFYLMCGDTSGSIENYNYTLSNIQLQFVPEPGTIALLVSGLIGMAVYAWRRKMLP